MEAGQTAHWCKANYAFFCFVFKISQPDTSSRIKHKIHIYWKLSERYLREKRCRIVKVLETLV